MIVSIKCNSKLNVEKKKTTTKSEEEENTKSIVQARGRDFVYLFADALLPCDVQMGQEEKKNVYIGVLYCRVMMMKKKNEI